MIVSSDGLHIGTHIVPLEPGWCIEYAGNTKWLTEREGYTYSDGTFTLGASSWVLPAGAELSTVAEVEPGTMTIQHEWIA